MEILVDQLFQSAKASRSESFAKRSTPFRARRAPKAAWEVTRKTEWVVEALQCGPPKL